MERDQATSRPENVQDMAAYAEACTVFGTEGAQARLHTFLEELAQHLSAVGQEEPAPAWLRDMAHRTAGRSGLLGFAALARASVDLDEAVRHDADIPAALERWRQQAVRAVEAPVAGN